MGYIDLHTHWVSGIDDGVKTVADGVELLRRLGSAGFTTVIATPHMRPSMFDNDRTMLRAAYDRMVVELPPALPEVGLSSEHFFDDIVHGRIVRGEAVPYPGDRAILIELSSGLDYTKNGSLALRLDSIYNYMIDALTLSNREGDMEALLSCESVLKILSDAWHQAVTTEQRTVAEPVAPQLRMTA